METNLKVRLIPVLLLKNGMLVRSELFHTHQIIGDPLHEVKRFNEWNVDELVYLDITREGGYDDRISETDPLTILDEVSRTCFMPLTWGGRISSIDEMRERFRRGADKIAINTEAFARPELINEGAKLFGSQAIVVSVDAKEVGGRQEVFLKGGSHGTGRPVIDWVRECEDRGAGEILLQSIDRDGTGKGYDVDLISEVTRNVSIPVIACSGAGKFQDYPRAIEAGASAVAAANLWHFKELADRLGKKALAKAGVNVRLARK